MTEDNGATVSPWCEARPELVVAGVLVVVVAVAGYATAGWSGVAVVAVATAAIAMAVLRGLLPRLTSARWRASSTGWSSCDLDWDHRRDRPGVHGHPG